MKFTQSSTLELAKSRSALPLQHRAPVRASLRPVVLMDDAGQPFVYDLRESTAQFMCSDDAAALQTTQMGDDRYTAAFERMKALMANMLEPRKELGLRAP